MISKSAVRTRSEATMGAWKEASTLIIAARHAQISTKNLPVACDYKLLCLKRNQKMNFMPGQYVFPGGAADSHDTDLKWKHLFANFGFNTDSFANLVPNVTRSSSIFDSKSNNALPKEVSLRITAIRETFEECGVLICKQRKDFGESANWASHLLVPDEEELQAWQTKVHEDASQFYEFCEKYKCYPDLWSLHEWSNWLTPTLYKKRFDTAFFIACMSSTPQAAHHVSEMDDLIWDTPRNLLRGDKVLPLPQLYDISRIAKFELLEDLLSSAVERGKLGTQRILPVMVQLKDGLVHLLPSDSLYPEQVSLIERQVIDKLAMSIAELRAVSPIKKRAESYVSPAKMGLVMENCEDADDHISMKELEVIRAQMNNKL